MLLDEFCDAVIRFNQLPLQVAILLVCRIDLFPQPLIFFFGLRKCSFDFFYFFRELIVLLQCHGNEIWHVLRLYV